jgi:hypothetical protein
MKVKDFIHGEVINNFKYGTENYFIMNHGQRNCCFLTFNSPLEVFKLINTESEPLTKEQKRFIIQNQNKLVLCYINTIWEDEPDIFVFGDDNIAFTKDCFKTSPQKTKK